MDGRFFYVGTESEVAHHARPLQPFLNVSVMDAEEVAQAARPGDVAIFYSEHFDRFRSACVALRSRQVATLYAIDGILEWRNAWENRPDEIACPWTMRPCLSHVVATIGPRQNQILSSWGNPQCVPIGLPRLDHLSRHYGAAPTTEPSRPSDCTNGVNRTSTDPSKFRLMILTAKCPGFTAEQLETTYRSLVAVREDIRRDPFVAGREIEIVWRLTGGLDQRLGIDQNSWQPNVAPETTLAELLSRVDAVIATPSTAQLEAAIAHRPVASLDFHNTPTYTDSVFRISSAEHVRPVLDQLARFSNSPAHQHMQHFLLHENLLADGQATARMVQLLKWMQRRSRECHDAGQPLQFATSEVVAHLSYAQPIIDNAFWARPNFCVTAESSHEATNETNPRTGMTSAQWQAYSEQLERENRRLAQLVTEAHQVFDNLHGHPVWGTLLKSHEWWSRLWQGESGKLAKPESWKDS
ncbi:MAG: hypothetical protein JNL67_13815 [Planctomycetaceae bacterium]|nr:hypothetical protein [Planctomycetaceae bacterium]